MNIGTGIGTSIRELVETINAVTGFRGKIAWNADKPDGAMMKVLDVSRMKQALDGWAPPTEPEGGPGQDHRLVPGQQGPGGRQMVNRRHWHRHATAPGIRRRSRTASRHGLSGRLDRDRSRRQPVRAAAPAPRLGARGTAATGKRILFINQYYWPDHASTAQHLTDLAESLAAAGLRVPRADVAGPLQAGRAAGRRPTKSTKGVHIHRVPATSLGRRGTWARMTDYLSFYAGAIVKALLLPRFDVVVTLTTPPIIGLVGTLLKRLEKTRHIYWSMDLHPDASLALGRMSPTSLFGRADVLAERLRLSPGR